MAVSYFGFHSAVRRFRLLRKLQIPWSTESPGYHLRSCGQCETLTSAQVSPSPAVNLQYHLMLSYREVCYIDCIHEPFGLEVDVFG